MSFHLNWDQSILMEVSPEYSLEGLMLKLKLQYFGHVMWRTNSLERTLILEKTEGRRRRGWQGWDDWMAHQHEFEQVPGAGEGRGSLACCSPCGPRESDTIEQPNWTEARVELLTSLILMLPCLRKKGRPKDYLGAREQETGSVEPSEHTH